MVLGSCARVAVKSQVCLDCWCGRCKRALAPSQSLTGCAFSCSLFTFLSPLSMSMLNAKVSEEVVPFVSSLVIILQNMEGTMFGSEEASACKDGKQTPTLSQMHETLVNMDTIVSSVLHDFRISNASALLGAEVGY